MFEFLTVTWALFVALLFAIAIGTSIAATDRVDGAVSDLGLPRGLARVAMIAEAALVALLLTSPRWGLLGVASYLGIATAAFAVSKGLLGREHADCGCFGTTHPVDRVFFARNALLIVISAVLAIGAGDGGLPGPVAVFASMAVVALALAAAIRGRRNRLTARPGAEHA